MCRPSWHTVAVPGCCTERGYGNLAYPCGLATPGLLRLQQLVSRAQVRQTPGWAFRRAWPGPLASPGKAFFTAKNEVLRAR